MLIGTWKILITLCTFGVKSYFLSETVSLFGDRYSISPRDYAKTLPIAQNHNIKTLISN